MKATVKWVDNAMFLGESGSGHSVVMDGPEDHGGRNMGIRPMEMILIGLGGCASFDVIGILKKHVKMFMIAEQSWSLSAPKRCPHPLSKSP